MESFILLKEIGPACEYFPAGNKSILINTPPKDSPNGRVLAPFNFIEKEGSRYLGGFMVTTATRGV